MAVLQGFCNVPLHSWSPSCCARHHILATAVSWKWAWEGSRGNSPNAWQTPWGCFRQGSGHFLMDSCLAPAPTWMLSLVSARQKWHPLLPPSRSLAGLLGGNCSGTCSAGTITPTSPPKNCCSLPCQLFIIKMSLIQFSFLKLFVSLFVSPWKRCAVSSQCLWYISSFGLAQLILFVHTKFLPHYLECCVHFWSPPQKKDKLLERIQWRPQR